MRKEFRDRYIEKLWEREGEWVGTDASQPGCIHYYKQGGRSWPKKESVAQKMLLQHQIDKMNLEGERLARKIIHTSVLKIERL